MSNKKSLATRAKYREEIGRQFASKFSLTIGNGSAAEETPVLYQADSHSRISREVRNMNTRTLARIIESTPEPFEGKTVHLLLPRHTEHGLESLNCLDLSGRQYLEVMAHCAIVGAVFDYLRGPQTEQPLKAQ
jgi:hypothetical protein